MEFLGGSNVWFTGGINHTWHSYQPVELESAHTAACSRFATELRQHRTPDLEIVTVPAAAAAWPAVVDPAAQKPAADRCNSVPEADAAAV